jgi:SAM-dependent methyltransferase
MKGTRAEDMVTPVIVDLGCGHNKRQGAFGFDCRKQPGVDALCDIEVPLPLRNDSADIVHLSHVVEHVRDVLFFMEEVYRICKPGAEVHVAVPYYTSRGAFRDPTHVRYITEDTFQYFEQPTDYGVRTNFRIEAIRYDTRKPFRYLPEYLRKRCRRYLWNVVDNMYVTLRAVKA